MNGNGPDNDKVDFARNSIKNINFWMIHQIIQPSEIIIISCGLHETKCLMNDKVTQIRGQRREPKNVDGNYANTLNTLNIKKTSNNEMKEN